MYSKELRITRRCAALTRKGVQCKAFALWGNPAKTCAVHFHTRRQRPGRYRYPWRAPLCHCSAMQWPHRIHSAGCRYPAPPAWICTTPSGRHRGPRLRGLAGAYARTLQKLDPKTYGTRFSP